MLENFFMTRGNVLGAAANQDETARPHQRPRLANDPDTDRESDDDGTNDDNFDKEELRPPRPSRPNQEMVVYGEEEIRPPRPERSYQATGSEQEEFRPTAQIQNMVGLSHGPAVQDHLDLRDQHSTRTRPVQLSKTGQSIDHLGPRDQFPTIEIPQGFFRRNTQSYLDNSSSTLLPSRMAAQLIAAMYAKKTPRQSAQSAVGYGSYAETSYRLPFSEELSNSDYIMQVNRDENGPEIKRVQPVKRLSRPPEDYLPPPGPYFDFMQLERLFGKFDWREKNKCLSCWKPKHTKTLRECDEECKVCKTGYHAGRECHATYVPEVHWTSQGHKPIQGYQIRPDMNEQVYLILAGILEPTEDKTKPIRPNMKHPIMEDFYKDREDPAPLAKEDTPATTMAKCKPPRDSISLEDSYPSIAVSADAKIAIASSSTKEASTASPAHSASPLNTYAFKVPLSSQLPTVKKYRNDELYVSGEEPTGGKEDVHSQLRAMIEELQQLKKVHKDKIQELKDVHKNELHKLKRVHEDVCSQLKRSDSQIERMEEVLGDIQFMARKTCEEQGADDSRKRMKFT
ncbi:hypothetical protein Alg130_10497 [Pyrenophora tritici-repentis]|nr:hypothetical protein PtrV1_10814 [Pyrenophora tritici-repentis]KAF7444007.1 hypothetical protein A1F99_120810 [Pyrenophora tritici-repentis]KAI0571562.1 hypothetical protein Alg215_10321 [Pyrenophora tritici-repentis]KAI0572442.1 hypothetical protein Alg130_10497 [Pyrenophora tritici-repentis]KAI0605754.1 hypothetical protein TUN205_09999 [Pyrenophora tritici-repentis]